jgi:hypothetical protein
MGPGRNSSDCAGVAPSMLQPWLQGLESLEALSRSGRMPSFLAEIEHDQELGEAAKGHVVELARDSSFLVAVEEYLRRTERVH